MSSGLVVRRLREEHAQAAADIMLGDGSPWLRYGLTKADALGVVTEGLASDDHNMLIATDGDTPIGWVWYEPRGTFHHAGYVRILAVDPAHRRRGAASALMDRAETAIFDVSSSVFLLASEWNERACTFYEKRGYRAVGRLEDYSCAGHVEAIYWLGRGAPLLAGSPEAR